MAIFTSFRQIQDTKVGSVKSIFQVIQQGCILSLEGFDGSFSVTDPLKVFTCQDFGRNESALKRANFVPKPIH